MPRHLISDAHEWINEIPTVPIYYLAKPQPRERAWQNQRGKKTLLDQLDRGPSGARIRVLSAPEPFWSGGGSPPPARHPARWTLSEANTGATPPGGRLNARKGVAGPPGGDPVQVRATSHTLVCTPSFSPATRGVKRDLGACKLEPRGSLTLV